MLVPSRGKVPVQGRPGRAPAAPVAAGVSGPGALGDKREEDKYFAPRPLYLFCIKDFALETLKKFLFCFLLPPVSYGLSDRGGHSDGRQTNFWHTKIFMIKY